MKQRVEIFKFNTVSDGYGGLLPTEAALLNTFAKVRYLSSSRQVEANQTQISQTIEVKIWQRSNYTPEVGQIVKYNNKSFSIVSVSETMECPKIQIITATAQ